MWSDFSVKPIMEQYGCVVYLLGRAGLLKEASEIIKGMSFEPDFSVLGALLSAYNIHGAVELGNEEVRRLLQFHPLHCGLFVLSSNINTGVEKWSVIANELL